MHNVHEDAPEVFETRWVLSYLRGPLTRPQITQLRKASVAGQDPKGKANADASSKKIRPPTQAENSQSFGQQPGLPPDVPQYFLSARRARVEGMTLVYSPRLFCSAHVHITDQKKEVDVEEALHLLAPITDEALPVDWDAVEEAGFEESDLDAEAVDEGRFADLPSAAGKATSYKKWNREWKNWIYRNHALELLRSPTLDEWSRPMESERDFRIRLQQVAHERRDVMVEHLRKKYAPKIATLQERIRRAELAVERGGRTGDAK